MKSRIPIINIFGPSPIYPIESHMTKVHECTSALQPFFHAVFEQNWPNANEYYKKIAGLEKEADILKKEIRMHLPKELFLPVPRGDLLQMLAYQDNIANKAKDIAGLVVGRQLQIPVSLQPDYLKFLQRCLDAETKAYNAINELDKLLEAGFKGREVTFVENMIEQLDIIEHDTDDMQIQLRHHLFEIEAQLSPIDVIFIYKIIEWTGLLANGAQTVGGQLELLLAH
jgi:predicted phosphate transport protein (TIGR00153 family)